MRANLHQYGTYPKLFKNPRALLGPARQHQRSHASCTVQIFSCAYFSFSATVGVSRGFVSSLVSSVVLSSFVISCLDVVVCTWMVMVQDDVVCSVFSFSRLSSSRRSLVRRRLTRGLSWGGEYSGARLPRLTGVDGGLI